MKLSYIYQSQGPNKRQFPSQQRVGDPTPIELYTDISHIYRLPFLVPILWTFYAARGWPYTVQTNACF